MALTSFLINEGSTLANEIVSNLYVDNIMMQAETPEEAIQKYRESKKLFEKIGMNLREYVSNSHEVNSRIPEIDKLQGTSMKILGVNYNTGQDSFSIVTNSRPMHQAVAGVEARVMVDPF